MEHDIKSDRLIIPVYINEKIVLDMLAIIEDGFSMVSQINYTEHTENNSVQKADAEISTSTTLLSKLLKIDVCNGVQREHNKKLNNGLPILHKVPPKRDYGRYFCIMAEKGGTSHGGLTEKLSPFFHAKKQEVNAYGR